MIDDTKTTQSLLESLEKLQDLERYFSVLLLAFSNFFKVELLISVVQSNSRQFNSSHSMLITAPLGVSEKCYRIGYIIDDKEFVNLPLSVPPPVEHVDIPTLVKEERQQPL